MKFCSDLQADFRKASNSELAIPMENYMKNNFSFLGIKTKRVAFPIEFVICYFLNVLSNIDNQNEV